MVDEGVGAGKLHLSNWNPENVAIFFASCHDYSEFSCKKKIASLACI